MKRKDFSLWVEEQGDELHNAIDKIINTINKTQIPQSFNTDFEYDIKDLRESLLMYFYENSYSSRKRDQAKNY